MEQQNSAMEVAPGRIIGAGEMADLVRGYDWGSTPLGPIGTWSKELVTIVNLTLASSSPARTMWGPELILIYNDAYRPFPGPRHPFALGKSARESTANHGMWSDRYWNGRSPPEKAFFTKSSWFHSQQKTA